MKALGCAILCLFFVVLIGQTAPATTQAGKVFESIRADKDQEPTADPDSPFWKGIPEITVSRSVLGPEMKDRHLNAAVRSRWTDQYLYFLFACQYENLTLNEHPDLVKETPHLWEKDVVELYIGADFQHTNRYRELQLSPQGEWLDNDIDSTVRRPGFNGEDKWNSGMSVKARVDEKNKIWYGEMKIPLAAIETTPARPAKVGNEFRVNVYRQDGAGTAAQGRNARTFMAWQPPGVWNPHHPEIFGTLRLAAGR